MVASIQTGIDARGRQAALDCAGELGSSFRCADVIRWAAASRAQHAAARIPNERICAGLTTVDA